jgi:hypothetical protein
VRQLNFPAIKLVRDGVIETPSLSNRLRVLPLYESRMEHRARIELAHQPYQSCAPPSTLTVQNGARCGTRSRLYRIQADHVAVYAYRAIKWSFAAESNCPHCVTNAACRLQHLRSMERSPGIKPGWLVWKTSA